MENWKPIKGYEGMYEISDLGRVKSLSRYIVKKPHCYQSKERILKLNTDKDGYKFLNLCKNKIKKPHRVHRLVADAFIPNIESKSQVNHIDCCKDNNVVSNLEWATPKENTLHAHRNGVIKNRKGENNEHSKLKQAEVLEIRKLRKEGVMSKDIAKKFNVTPSTICLIVNNKSWIETGNGKGKGE